MSTLSSAQAPSPAPTYEPLSVGRAIGMIAGREIVTRARSKSFIITTLVLVLGILGGGYVVSLLGERAAEPLTVVVDSPATGTALETAAALTGAFLDVQPSSGDVEVELVGTDVAAHVAIDGQDVEVTVWHELDPALGATVGALAERAALDTAISELGGDPDAVDTALREAAPTVTPLEVPADGEGGADRDEVDASQGVLGLITGILIFIGLMMTGQMVAQGVVEEKSSRVVELLLATVRPWHLIAGKVLGIGALGLLQVALVGGTGALSASMFGLLENSPVRMGPAVGWLIVWFILGYAMYAFILGALASLVSRQEDVGSVISPVMVVLIIPYMVGVSIAPYDPDNSLVVGLSYVPLFSPILMPIRSAMGGVEAWELAVTIGFSVVLIGLLVALAGTIYSRAVVRTGSRIPLREAFSQLRSS